ncbi:MAG: hypothetical protein OEZ59_06395 [Deltaproteobacteria bacterium]|nr:hypothetical protein [Deltaproteobacteria bacterium]
MPAKKILAGSGLFSQVVFRQIPVLLASVIILSACAPQESEDNSEPPIPEVKLDTSHNVFVESSIWGTSSTTLRFRTGNVRGLYYIYLNNSSAADMGWGIAPENEGVAGGAGCNNFSDTSDENCTAGVLEPNQSYLIYVNNHSSFYDAGGTLLITMTAEATLLTPDTPTSVAIEAGGRHYYQVIPENDSWALHIITVTSTQSAITGDLYSTNENRDKSHDFSISEHLSMTMLIGHDYILELGEMSSQADTYEITLGRAGEVLPLSVGVPISGTIAPYGDPLAPAATYFKYDSRPLLTFTPGEEYYYKISLTGAGTDVKWRAGEEFFVSNPILWCDNIADVGDEICWMVNGKTDYSITPPPTRPMYLEVYHYDTVSTPFEILVEEFPVPVLTSGVTVSSSIEAGGFRYFKFTSTEFVAHQFNLTNTQSNLSFEVIGQYKTEVSCDNVTSGAGDEICSIGDHYGSATYKIKVQEHDGVAGTFDFTVW